MHVGRRYLRRGGDRFENDAWHWILSNQTLQSKEWQRAVKAELSCIGWERKYAAEDKNPVLYARASKEYLFVAQFVVHERKLKSGAITHWVRDGLTGGAIPVGQKRLVIE